MIAENRKTHDADRGNAIGAALRRFATKQPAVERCDLCSAELAAEHEHLVDPATQQLICACSACAVLFGYQGETDYQRVPRRIERLRNFRLPDTCWNGLAIPIGLAYFYRNSRVASVVAMYPSPGGPVESLLSLDTWDELVELNPILNTMQPDVEALLVNRLDATRQYYRAPIDQCYRLVGLIRLHWRGFSGGAEMGKHLQQFFQDLTRRSRDPVPRAQHEPPTCTQVGHPHLGANHR